MTDIDLYRAHGLNRHAPPEALAAQLTAELNATDPRDALARNRIETARIVLGDPQRRARYDAQLADPAAPPLDEQALAQIAGRPLPVQKAGLAAAFATTQARVLAGVVGALALLLVVVIAVVATSGGGDDSTSTTATSGKSSSRDSDGSSYSREELEAWRGKAYYLDQAEWPGGSSTPDVVVHLNAAFDLPPRMAAIAGESDAPQHRLIRQLQDKSVVVYFYNKAGNGTDQENLIATYQDGRLISEDSSKSTDIVPQSFDLSSQLPTGRGYYQIVAGDGIAIPGAATGTETDQVFAIAILPDAFDKKLFWVLLRGGTKLYQADLRRSQAYIDAHAPK